MDVTCGSATNIGTMYVGYTAGFTGTFDESGGVVQVTNNLIVGAADCVNGAVGVAILSDGALYVTNAAHTAILGVGNGTFTMSGGTLVADTLDLSNPCGHFTYNSGDIHYNQLVVPPQAPPLALTITPDSQSSTLTIAWPSIYVGYALQQNLALSPSNWTPGVFQFLTDDGTTRSVTVSLGTGNLFYRLAKP